MHEMSVAGNLLDMCLEELKKNNGSQIRQVNLVIGNLAGIVPDSLEFCFNIMKENTPAADASLVIRTVMIQLVCRECKSEYTVEELPWICDNCGALAYDLKAGNEFMVESIIID